MTALLHTSIANSLPLLRKDVHILSNTELHMYYDLIAARQKLLPKTNTADSAVQRSFQIREENEILEFNYATRPDPEQ